MVLPNPVDGSPGHVAANQFHPFLTRLSLWIEEETSKLSEELVPLEEVKPKKPRSAKSWISRHTKIEVIEPGLVLLRNVVPDKLCRQLAKTAMKMGQEGEEGFYTKAADGETKILNTGEAGRGRIYDAATRFPRHITDWCRRSVKLARGADSAMPQMTCTHVILNMYTNRDGLVWHRDIYENDGKSDHPVVNLCVGASCLFGFKHEDSDPERVVKLNNGDCLLFGGRCRLIKHAVLEVLLEDCPDWMADDPCRFSFTFRDSPEVLGREEEFKYFRVDEHLVGQDEFEVPTDTSDWQALPSQKSQKKVKKKKKKVSP